MRALVLGLLAATALSSISFTAQPAAAAPFTNASAPLTAEELAGIKAESAEIKRKKAAAAERARKQREAAAAKRRAAKEAHEHHEEAKPVEAEPVISTPVTGDDAPAGTGASIGIPSTAPAMPDAHAPVVPAPAPSAAPAIPAAPSASLPVTIPAAVEPMAAPIPAAPAASDIPPAAPAAH